MAVSEGVNLVLSSTYITSGGRSIEVRDQADGGDLLAWIDVEILKGNVVVTVRRVDEAKTGPISVVMV